MWSPEKEIVKLMTEDRKCEVWKGFEFSLRMEQFVYYIPTTVFQPISL